MATDLKNKTLSYRGGMYILLALFSITIIGGVIIYRLSLTSHQGISELLDESIFYAIIAVAALMGAVAIFLSVRFSRNLRNLKRVVDAMDNGADIESMPDFARDELGDLSRHIIDLYQRLRQTSHALEHEHDKAIHEKEEKLRIKRQLTNNINHELKTPVAAIQGYLETIINNNDISDEERRSFIEKSYAHSQRLTQLLHDVSTITRLEDGSSRIETDVVDLRAIIDEVASEVKLLPQERQMRVNIDMPEMVMVNGNSTLLMSIIKNLTDNAIAYSGGRDIFIRLTEGNDAMHTITFSDNGIGIDEEHINHIFERFYRIDAGRSRKLGGTGLGLSIVKNAVLFHGGDIEVYNRKAGGLEFKFTLPIAEN